MSFRIEEKEERTVKVLIDDDGDPHDLHRNDKAS